MPDGTRLRRQLARQIEHWTLAAHRLEHLEDIASPESWGQLERYLGVSLRDHLRGVVRRLAARGEALRATFAAAGGKADLMRVRLQLLAFRTDYLRSETTIDFYADAINTRTNPTQGALLRACDTLAYRSMAEILEPLGHETPVALTYIDKGLGASILKAGLRLWDGGALNVTAAIKIVRHNLLRPTSLIHESGHQVAHVLDWNDELARALESGLPSPALGRVWAAWASEIAADAVAFVHTGYGAVMALHDVLAGEPEFVLQVVAGDPHPMSFLRVELGVAMCRRSWGDGPWDDLSATWREIYPPERAPSGVRALISASLPALPKVAQLTLAQPAHAFRGRSLSDVVSPDRVSPRALADLEHRLGPALFSSSHWIWTECLRLLAISALRADEDAERSAKERVPVEHWMLRLGGARMAA